MKCITVFTLLLYAFSLRAQDALTIKDAEEIRYKSESLIKREFRDLLNNIANTDIDLADTKKIIFNAHSGTRNKIFLSARVQMEDDINPNFHSSNNSRDIEIEQYLNDFDLLYKKSDAPSVAFNNVKSSAVKKSQYLYVKVYFTSFFRNANKTNDTAYTLNNRVAEMRVEKEKSKWAVYISRVGFFIPADTVNDIASDVVLLREPNGSAWAATATDSAATARAQVSFDAAQKEEARSAAIEEDRRETISFNDLIKKGDQALDINDFTGALKFYKEAREMRPYDPLPPSKINNANKLKERATITAGQLYEQYIHKATLSENRREYQQAIGFYNDAIAQKPDEAARLENKKRDLTEKFRVISELDEKYKAGLYKEALKEYDAAIKKNKTNPDLYLGRGKCYEKTNDVSRALKDYTQSYELDRNNLEAIEKRAALYKRNKDYFKSLTDYKTYITISRENTTIYEEMASLRMLINNNTEEAIRDINDGLAVDPKATSLYLNKGLLLLQKNDLRAADNNFSSVIKLDSNNALGYYLRGKCQVLMNHAAAAGTDFSMARQKGLDAENLNNIDAYAAGFFQRSLAKQNEPLKDSAILLADDAIAINPMNSVYRFIRGEYYFSAHNYKEAINNYDQALSIEKNYTDAFNRRGQARQYLGEYKSAIENFSAALKLSPQLITAQKGLGDAHLALADYNNAIIYFEQFMQTAGAAKTPPNPVLVADAYNSLGKAYTATNNNEKALTAFKNAVKKNPGSTEAMYNRGLALCKTGELQDGIADMTKAVTVENNHYEWHYQLGKAYQERKEFANAATCFNNCVQTDTTARLPDAVYYRGYNNYLLQNYAAALTDYAKVYNNMNGVPGLSLNNEMGNIYLNLGKYDSAYEYYDRARTKDSGNGAALYGLGSVLFLKGKPEDALAWFEKSFQTKTVNYNDVKKDKLIAALRDDKRFKALVKKYY
jgi:tetratricopeptide (TPR) repeat protein